MMEELVWLKNELGRRRRSQKELARELGYTYNKTSLIVNGYSATPGDWDSKVRSILRRWDDEGRPLITPPMAPGGHDD